MPGVRLSCSGMRAGLLGDALLDGGGDEDLAAGSAGEKLVEGFGGLVEGQNTVDHGLQGAVIHELGEPSERLPVGGDEQEPVAHLSAVRTTSTW